MIDVLTREGKVRWCFTASQPPTVSDSRTPFQIGELTDGRMRPITFATLLLIFKLPHRAASAGPATPRLRFPQALHSLRHKQRLFIQSAGNQNAENGLFGLCGTTKQY
jgi:hypothetical protein